MDELKISQLTKELVAEELRRLGDPCAAAAAVVRKTLVVALKTGGPVQERAVEDAVRGGMTALLLADQSLARGAIRILDAVVEAAAELELDPTAMMSAALSGLAGLKRYVDPSRLDDIRVEIDARFMGAGEVFAQRLRAGESAPR